MKKFDIKEFLTENKLTQLSKRLDEGWYELDDIYDALDDIDRWVEINEPELTIRDLMKVTEMRLRRIDGIDEDDNIVFYMNAPPTGAMSMGGGPSRYTLYFRINNDRMNEYSIEFKIDSAYRDNSLIGRLRRTK